MSIGIFPIASGAPLLAGGAAAATLALLVVFGSNRLQRRINSWLALCVGSLPSRRQRDLMSRLTRIEGTRDMEEFLDKLPWMVSRAAGVTPVTLFLLHGARFVPVRGTRLAVRLEPFLEDDPLVGMLRRSNAVHYLCGRTDDLQNAPIHAVNGEQIEACGAVAAIPLRREGSLLGFLLCGGLHGSRELDLGSMAALESMARCCAAKLETLEREPGSTPLELIEEDEVFGAEMPVVIERRLRAATVRRHRGGDESERFADDRGVEPQLAGSRGGYQTND